MGKEIQEKETFTNLHPRSNASINGIENYPAFITWVYSSEGTKIAPAFSGSKLAGQIVFLVYFAPL
jgi:hypothetical protein